MADETSRYYAQLANEFERVYGRATPGNDELAIAELFPRLFAGKRVYEVACGAGRWTRLLAQVAAEVYATDANEKILERARKYEYPPGVVTFARADASAINPNPPKFNGGLVGFWLSHVDKARMREFLEAFHSWLEPGAVVLMFDDLETTDRARPSRMEEASELNSSVVYSSNRLEERILPGGERFEIIENFYAEESLVDLLGGYGTDLEYQELESKWVLRYLVR